MEQLYCDADGTLAICCIDGFHSVGNILKLRKICDYWNQPVIQEMILCFQEDRLPGICGQCNFILLDSLRRLKVEDRKTYVESRGERGDNV